jgi:DNA-binding NarL/FixJ family response regulator
MDKAISIVVADDSRAAVVRLVHMLSSIEGVDVVGQAQDGAEAVRVVLEARPDLAILDVVMPGMTGIEALRVIRARRPGQRVAMLTSLSGNESTALEAFRCGALQVLSKPCDPAQLEALVEAVRAELSGDAEAGR